MTSRLCERLELDQPVIQAPMAGGATTVALVAESSRAGVLGSLGAAYLSAAQIEQAAGAIRERTDRPYAINLFASVPDQPYRGDGARLLALMARYHAQLGLDAPAMPARRPIRWRRRSKPCCARGRRCSALPSAASRRTCWRGAANWAS